MRKPSCVASEIACLGLLLALAGCSDSGSTTPSPTPAPAPTPSGGPVGDMFRGGALYDKWWPINGGVEPTSTHPGYPSTGQQSGSTTWRCKECHGWDYKGVNGAYSTGSHRTGIAGVLASRGEPARSLFNQIKMGGNHDFSAVLRDRDIEDLVAFIQMGMIDMNSLIDFGSRQSKGDVTNGQALWSGTGRCVECHGADGRGNPADVPGESRSNPWEVLHKIRWGQPGTFMPTAVGAGLSPNDQADILAYAQSLP